MKESQNIKVAVDAIVFGYTNERLSVLLVKQKFGEIKGQWVLVGGFVKNDESLKHAVERELREEAGVKVNFLEQLYTFGDDIQRDPRARVISVAYFALVNSTQLHLTADTDAEEAKWFPIDQLPALGYDHNEIVKLAHLRLKTKLSYQPIGFDLLPERFLFSELENLYTSILEKQIDRRNFRKKILSFDIVEETDEYSPIKNGRPAKLFRFNSQKYRELEKRGFHFEIKFT